MAALGRTKVEVVGQLDNGFLARASAAVKFLTTTCARDVDCTIATLTQCEWVAYRSQQEKRHGASVRVVSEAVLISVNDIFMANVDEFVKWAAKHFGYAEKESNYCLIASDQYEEYFQKANSIYVYFDVACGDENIGKMIFELDSKNCPKTAANFAALCIGWKTAEPPHLAYLNTIFHRVQEGGWVQGGDVCTAPDNGSFDLSGTGGASIYGRSFADENFICKHDSRGVLSMANSGIHSNASQFCISLRALPWMHQKYVAFGKLVEGSHVLDKLESVHAVNGRPVKPCKITSCGIYPKYGEVRGGVKELSIETDVNDAHSPVSASFCIGETWTVPVLVNGAGIFPAAFEKLKFEVPANTNFTLKKIVWGGVNKLEEELQSQQLAGRIFSL